MDLTSVHVLGAGIPRNEEAQELLLEKELRLSSRPVWVRRQGAPEDLQDLCSTQQVGSHASDLFVDTMGPTICEELEPHNHSLPACGFSHVLLVLTTGEARVHT